MNITIRDINPEDFQQAIRVIQRANRESLGKIYPAALVEEFCKKYTLESFTHKAKETDFFVAEDLDVKKLLGIIGLKENVLRTFFVDPAFQGHGIGRKLYERLEDEARQRGIKKLVLEGSPLGEPAYEKFGFKRTGTIEKERIGIKYSDTHMEKKL